MTGVVTLVNGATPSTPASGITAVFVNSSGVPCYLGNDGVVRPLWQENAPSTQTGASYSQVVGDTSLVFNTSATHTLTLLAGSAWPGKIIHLMNLAAYAINSASSNVYPGGSNTLGTAILAATAGKWCTLQSDGTNWRIMANN